MLRLWETSQTSEEPIIYCVEFETRKDQNAKLNSTILNGKARAIKFLEENLGKYLCDFDSGKDTKSTDHQLKLSINK